MSTALEIGVVRLPQALGQRIDIAPTLDSIRQQVLDAGDRIDRDRRLPRELVDTLWEAGVFSTVAPREVGGLELHPADYLDLIFELARLNGTVSWISIFQKGSLPLLPSPVMLELIEQAEGRLLFASSHSAVGRADRVSGGYRVSGSFPFASGLPWSTHVTVWVDVFSEDGEPEIDLETGAQRRIDAVVRFDEVEYFDNWDVLGLRGSGSGGFEVHDVFVPERMTTDGVPPEEYADRPFLSTPNAAEMGAMVLGCAHGAIDRYLARGEKPGRKADPSIDELRRIRLADAETTIRAARDLLWRGALITSQAEAGDENLVIAASFNDPASDAQSDDYMIALAEELAANSYAVRVAKDAVNTIFEIAGTAAIRVDVGIERCLRDVYTASHHAGNAYRNLSMRGDYLMTKDNPNGPVIAVPPPLS
ncbi:acyl-CoA dehydrogenase family protein [Leifsonia kafniensis]|uniref:Acyl-CoA dehydrogenase family protein n=1 Tax=Leifsonia kafniensis TaxID=475957 RepID=A0ABP7KPC7_9MICO